jgi:heat shock protein HtpX
MNTLRNTFLLSFLSVNVVTTGKTLGGEEGALIAFTFALATHGINYWFSDRIMLRTRRAKEVQPDEAPRLYRIVQELTLRAQMPMPKFYLLPQHTPTAFATGREEKYAVVAFSEDLHPTGETLLRGALTRELLQIKNRDRLAGTIIASVTGAISLLANIGE